MALVGGGVIGLSVAWRAAQRGLRCVVLDRGEPGGGASHVAAGMLAPTSEAAFGERALTAFSLACAQRWPAFAAEVQEASGRDPCFAPVGSLMVARDRDEAEALERELAYRRSLDLRVERLAPSAARRLEPALAPSLRLALDVPDDHAVDPRALCAGLAQAARLAGATIRPHTEVEALTVRDDRVDGIVLAGGERLAAGAVVLAAGSWSGSLPGLPDHARLPIRPVKGQIVRLRDPAGPGLLTRVLRMADGYLVPRGDGRYVLGATVEERGFDPAVTAGAAFELLRAAIELVPGIAELTIEELSVGFRPATPDNAPALGPGALAGLHWATGHFRHGVLLAPLSADAVVAGLLAEDGQWPASARPFAAARFAPTGALAP